VGRARVALVALVLAAATADSRAADGQIRLVLWADRDDDDADGKPDCEQDPLPAAAKLDTIPIERQLMGATLTPTSGGEHVRLVVEGKPLPWGRPIYGPGVFQGVSAGEAKIVANLGRKQIDLTVVVRGVSFRDGDNKGVDLTRGHASIARTPPARFDGGPDAKHTDPDALRVVIEVPEPAPPSVEVAVESLSPVGVRVDILPRVPLTPIACDRKDLRCFVSAPLRYVMDDVDRTHPLVIERSLRAEVGGAIVVRHETKKAQHIRVLGPRATPVGAIKRLKATLRPFVLRMTAGGAPAIGGTDAGAILALRSELGAAAAIWGQCGLTFGDTRTLDVKIVDPPPPHLVSLGDDLGLPASGGEIRLKIDGKAVNVPIAPGASTERAALDLARAVEKAGLVAVISPNARIGPGSSGSVDVSIRRKDGTFATVEPQGSGVSTDETLSVRIGSVDLSDGLQHFTDMDAMAGTLEERTLLKAFDDGDPQTLEVVVVPLFAGGGRIGESFIGSDLSSLRNVVLLDRAGIRARKSSLTLAHELGHVLMDMPGHPDDYGVDTPTLLMDSDASDASPFGPRRLGLDECARVVRQAGPTARVPLLTEWPVTPMLWQ
jgi:hypothetical protein